MHQGPKIHITIYCQPDYREKVIKTIKWVTDNGYKPAFLSEVLFG